MGYLTLFRGIHSRESQQVIKLCFIRDKSLQLENLMTGEWETIAVDNRGNARFRIDRPAAARS